ncbi:MAG: enoyl-CoA hydratase/isomerase family protein [Hyphomicrobiales bacterium]
MAFEFIDLDRRGPVGWYRFNRPPRNAVPMEMLNELTPAFEALIADPDVRVIVLASAVEGYFSTGADIATFRAAGPDQMSEWTDTSHNLARTIRASSKPVLAAISGVAVGGGLEMTFHADLRFAASNARLGQPEVNIGFIPPVGGTQGLVRLVGRAEAFRMLYGGEIMDAAAALRIGLVDAVVPSEQLASEVQAYGEMLATKPANTLASIRRCLIDGGERSFDDGLEVEAREARALAQHENFREGVTAFLDKRKPRWSRTD